ncbi:MAG: hybrid sensor histidine kinase/response regulator [Pirellulaceae bacterium]|nr:hybrid sensor histidine kinase/response regulator [Pirellulaceae bacterium]
MFLITIENPKQQKQYLHEEGILVIGRQSGGGEACIVIDDDYVSRRHLVLEQISPIRIRFENVGRNDLELPDGIRIGQGACGEADLPIHLRIAQTTIRLALPEADRSDESLRGGDSDADDFQTVSLPATRQLPTVTRSPLASLGDVPSAEKLTVWFETLLSVQRSTVGSEEFYQETARAIVDLVGLDRGLVLLRQDANWRIVASWVKDQKVAMDYSRSILARVVDQGRTFFGTPHARNTQQSLENVEAVVGSPIFGSSGAVVGVLYGSRDWGSETSHAGIQPLEAQVVQLLASSVSCGLIRMEMQQRLRQVEQLAAVGQAIAYIIHDLRGPLANVQQLLEIWQHGLREELGREEQLQLIDESLAVALDLLDDSLEFCRGTVQVKPVRGTFAGLLGKHLRLLRLELETLGVALQVEAPAELQFAFDPERMARVLRNLARNAAEAMQGHPGAAVTIGARQTPAGVAILVADNGPGIPPEVLGRLFQPFGTHGKKGGTGFGLAIAKQLVEAHRGQITVSSGGKGTRFTIALPAEVEDADATDVPVATRTQTNLTADRTGSDSRRVLLVEDGQVNQRLISGLLRFAGHAVEVVSNGREAVDACSSQAFDVVLMDVEMPVMDGRDASRAIRELERATGRHVAIVALSAHPSAENRAECLAAGMDAVLVKPLRADELDAILRQLPSSPMVHKPT